MLLENDLFGANRCLLLIEWKYIVLIFMAQKQVIECAIQVPKLGWYQTPCKLSFPGACISVSCWYCRIGERSQWRPRFGKCISFAHKPVWCNISHDKSVWWFRGMWVCCGIAFRWKHEVFISLARVCQVCIWSTGPNTWNCLNIDTIHANLSWYSMEALLLLCVVLAKMIVNIYFFSTFSVNTPNNLLNAVMTLCKW